MDNPLTLFEQVLSDVLGGISVAKYISGFIFAIIGVLLSLYINDARKRNVNSPETPKTFSLWFLIKDNIVRLVGGLLLTFIAFRFSAELLQQELTMWYTFLVGFLSDKLISILEKVQKKSRFTTEIDEEKKDS